MAAPIHWSLALATREALWTGAAEAGVGGAAHTPVQAGPREAGVGLMLAVGTSVARAAQTAERVHAIHAGATVETGAGAAVRQILLAMQASIARWAGASEGSHVVSAGAWATRAAQTLVHVPGTVWTGEPRQAGAGERARAILTGAAIQTGVGVTVIDVLVTGRASVPPMAGTTETPHQVGAGTVGATG